MIHKKITVLLSAVVLSAILTACGSGSQNEGKSPEPADVTENDIQEITQQSAEETTEELIPPEPVEASDPNSVTFDDENFSFASLINDDEDSAKGELSIGEIQGNKMLKFTDDNTVDLDKKVQKISINAVQLIGAENLSKVRSIEFDLYAQAVADNLVNDEGENVKAPGWIGGGGGTVTAKNDKWYNFSEFEGGEYNFETSGAVHVVFKFLLSAGGEIWSEDMTDANFLIMRWGLSNESDTYIDNITFFDEDGNSIPLSENTESSSESDTNTEEITGE